MYSWSFLGYTPFQDLTKGKYFDPKRDPVSVGGYYQPNPDEPWGGVGSAQFTDAEEGWLQESIALKYKGQPMDPGYIHTNYMTDGKDTFLLTPEEHEPDQLYQFIKGSHPVYDYRGHEFRLWNADGTPTEYKLGFFHTDGPPPRGDQPPDSYRFFPSGAKRNEFQEDFLGHDEGGWISASESFGYLPSNLVDRDTHAYAIYKDTNIKPFPTIDQARNLPVMDPAPDPVQREAMPNTTPRSVPMSRGESKVAAQVASVASARFNSGGESKHAREFK